MEDLKPKPIWADAAPRTAADVGPPEPGWRPPPDTEPAKEVSVAAAPAPITEPAAITPRTAKDVGPPAEGWRPPENMQPLPAESEGLLAQIPIGAKLGLKNAVVTAARAIDPGSALSGMGIDPNSPENREMLANVPETREERAKVAEKGMTEALFPRGVPETKGLGEEVVRGFTESWPTLAALFLTGGFGTGPVLGEMAAPVVKAGVEVAPGLISKTAQTIGSAALPFGIMGATDENPVAGAAKGAVLGATLGGMHLATSPIEKPFYQWLAKIGGGAAIGGGATAVAGGGPTEISRDAIIFGLFEALGMPEQKKNPNSVIDPATGARVYPASPYPGLDLGQRINSLQGKVSDSVLAILKDPKIPTDSPEFVTAVEDVAKALQPPEAGAPGVPTAPPEATPPTPDLTGERPGATPEVTPAPEETPPFEVQKSGKGFVIPGLDMQFTREADALAMAEKLNAAEKAPEEAPRPAGGGPLQPGMASEALGAQKPTTTPPEGIVKPAASEKPVSEAKGPAVYEEDGWWKIPGDDRSFADQAEAEAAAVKKVAAAPSPLAEVLTGKKPVAEPPIQPVSDAGSSAQEIGSGVKKAVTGEWEPLQEALGIKPETATTAEPKPSVVPEGVRNFPFGTSRAVGKPTGLLTEGLAPGVDPEATGFQPASREPGSLPTYARFPTEGLELAPKVFQHKRAADLETGVPPGGGSLANTPYKEADAMHLEAFETRDGKFLLAHGHNRLWAAKRDSIQTVPIKVYREADGWTPEAVKMAAFKRNVTDGRLDALDIAQFLREIGGSEEDLKGNINLRTNEAQNGIGLSGLSQRIWEDVYEGKWGRYGDEKSADKGAALGGPLRDNPAAQEAIYKRLRQLQEEGKEYSPAAIRSMAEAGRLSVVTKKAQGGLDFGQSESDVSLVIERGVLDDYLKSALATKKNSLLAANRNQAELEAAGNVITPEENKRLAAEAKEVLGGFGKFKEVGGSETDNFLNRFAEELSNAKSQGEENAIKQRAVTEIYNALAADREAFTGQRSAAVRPEGPESGGGEAGKAVPAEEPGNAVEVASYYSFKDGQLGLFGGDRPLTKFEKRLNEIVSQYEADPERVAQAMRATPKASDREIAAMAKMAPEEAGQVVKGTMTAMERAELAKRQGGVAPSLFGEPVPGGPGGLFAEPEARTRPETADTKEGANATEQRGTPAGAPGEPEVGAGGVPEAGTGREREVADFQSRIREGLVGDGTDAENAFWGGLDLKPPSEEFANSSAVKALREKAKAKGVDNVILVADAPFEGVLVSDNGKRSLVVAESVTRGTHTEIADHEFFHRDFESGDPNAKKFLDHVNRDSQAFVDYWNALNEIRAQVDLPALNEQDAAIEIAADASSGLTRRRNIGEKGEIDLREVFHEFDKARDALVEYRGEEGLPGRMEPVAQEMPRPPTRSLEDIKKAQDENAKVLLEKFNPLMPEGVSLDYKASRPKPWKIQVGESSWKATDYANPEDAVRAAYEKGVPAEIESQIDDIKSAWKVRNRPPNYFKEGDKIINTRGGDGINRAAPGEVGTVRAVRVRRGTPDADGRVWLEVKWNKSGVDHNVVSDDVDLPKERAGDTLRTQVAAAHSAQFRRGLENTGLSYLLDMSKSDALAEIAKLKEYWDGQKATWEKKERPSGLDAWGNAQATGDMDYILEGNKIRNWQMRLKEATNQINRYVKNEMARDKDDLSHLRTEPVTAKVGKRTLTQESLFSLRDGEERQGYVTSGEPGMSQKEFEAELLKDRGELDKMLREPGTDMIPLYEGERWSGTRKGDKIVDAKGRPVEITPADLYERFFKPTKPQLPAGEQTARPEDLLGKPGEDSAPGTVDQPPSGYFGKLLRSVREKFSAANISEKADLAHSFIVKNLGWMGREVRKAVKVLEPFNDRFSKMTQEEMLRFTDTVESNSLQELTRKAFDPASDFDVSMLRAATAWRRLADGLHYLRSHINETMVEEAEAAGKPVPDLETAYWEQYFPRLFKNPEEAAAKIQALLKSRGRSLTGPESFENPRSQLLFSDSIKPVEEGGLGLEPMDGNYINMMKANVWEQLRFLTGKYIEGDLKEAGFLADKKTTGWEQLKGDKTLEGYYAHPDVARVLDNFMSKGYRGDPLFELYNTPATFINTVLVGLSAFHATFSTFSDLAHGVGSNLTRGIGAALTGRFSLAGHHMAELAKSAAVPLNLIQGGKFIEEYEAPGTHAGEKFGETGTISQIVDLMEKGGIRVNSEELSQVARSFSEVLRDDKVGLPRKVVDLIAWPIMSYMVPRIKINATARLLQMELDTAAREGRKLTEQQQVKLAQDVARKSDNIFGQMVYDNLSMTRGLRDAMRILVGFPGWNIGSFTDMLQAGKGIVHGVGEAGKAGAEFLTGQKPTWEAMSRQNRMSLEFYLGTVLTMAVFGAITQRLLTGKWPGDSKDLLMPKTGAMMANGQAERIRPPTYMRDVLGLSHPIEMAKHKLNFPLRMFSALTDNQDFFGEQIRDPYASTGKQIGQTLKYVGKSLLPFGIQGYMATESPQAKGMNLIGVTKVPRLWSNTPALNVMDDYNKQNRAAMTSKQAGEEKRLKGDLRKLAGAGDEQGFREAAAEAMQEGTLTHQQIKGIIEESQEPTPGLGRFKALPIEWQLRAWEVASPKEKDAWEPIFLKKVGAAKPEILIRNRDNLVPVLQKMGLDQVADMVEGLEISEQKASKFDLSSLGIRKPEGGVDNISAIDAAISQIIKKHLDKLGEAKKEPAVKRVSLKEKKPFAALGF